MKTLVVLILCIGISGYFYMKDNATEKSNPKQKTNATEKSNPKQKTNADGSIKPAKSKPAVSAGKTKKADKTVIYPSPKHSLCGKLNKMHNNHSYAKIYRHNSGKYYFFTKSGKRETLNSLRNFFNNNPYIPRTIKYLAASNTCGIQSLNTFHQNLSYASEISMVRSWLTAYIQLNIDEKEEDIAVKYYQYGIKIGNTLMTGSCGVQHYMHVFKLFNDLAKELENPELSRENREKCLKMLPGHKEYADLLKRAFTDERKTLLNFVAEYKENPAEYKTLAKALDYTKVMDRASSYSPEQLDELSDKYLTAVHKAFEAKTLTAKSKFSVGSEEDDEMCRTFFPFISILAKNLKSSGR